MEDWVLRKILEAREKQPTHQLTQVMVVYQETGEAKGLKWRVGAKQISEAQE